MLSYASAVSCMYDILVNFSAVAELESFKYHSTGQNRISISIGLTVHQPRMNLIKICARFLVTPKNIKKRC